MEKSDIVNGIIDSIVDSNVWKQPFEENKETVYALLKNLMLTYKGTFDLNTYLDSCEVIEEKVLNLVEKPQDKEYMSINLFIYRVALSKLQNKEVCNGEKQI